jgi:hypothetical protein
VDPTSPYLKASLAQAVDRIFLFWVGTMKQIESKDLSLARQAPLVFRMDIFGLKLLVDSPTRVIIP